MKVSYDPKTDTLSMVLKDDVAVASGRFFEAAADKLFERIQRLTGLRPNSAQRKHFAFGGSQEKKPHN